MVYSIKCFSQIEMTSEHRTTDGLDDFEEGENPCAGRKPSKSGWDWLKLNLHSTFVVEAEAVIDVPGVHHRKSIQMVTHSHINPIQQGVTWMNRRELVFPFGASRTQSQVQAVLFRPTNYEQCLHLSEWVTHLHIEVPARNPFLRFAYPWV